MTLSANWNRQATIDLMRIHDLDHDRSLNMVSLFLTTAEASELRDSLETLLQDNAGAHSHVSSSDYAKDLTIVLYDPASTIGQNTFSDRVKRLIAEDV